MLKDPIVEEVRRHRAAHAAKFNHDLRAICDDLRRWEAAHPERMAASPAKTRRATVRRKKAA